MEKVISIWDSYYHSIGNKLQGTDRIHDTNLFDCRKIVDVQKQESQEPSCGKTTVQHRVLKQLYKMALGKTGL